jgi:class 3 adenylate cyclase
MSVEQSVLCRANAASLWPHLSNTDILNRSIGTNALDFSALEQSAVPSAARFLIRTKVAGFTLEYEEEPFEWTEHERFSVVRRMRRGPIKGYRFGVLLEPRGESTRVVARLELAAAHPLLAPLVRVLGARICANIASYVRKVDAELATATGARPRHAPRNEAVHRTRILTGLDALEKDDLAAKPILQGLRALLLEGEDHEVTRLRPCELADKWQQDRMRTLGVMLRAVHAGLLELRWSIICPSCLVPANTVSALEEIEPPGHCQFCDISFGIDLDRAVEATFVPHPATRTVDTKPFCIGGPNRTPHVLVQRVVDQEAVAEFAAPREPGRYRIFARGGAIAGVEVSEGSTPAENRAAREIILERDVLTPSRLELTTGEPIALTNRSGEPRHIKLERVTYAGAAATAYIISNVPEFRRFFSRDLLKPKTPMKIARVSLLFSDLTGSTALYERAGDAAAFRFVDDHFDALRVAIEPAGVVVKTMGDAIMASYLEPDAAVRSAHAMLRAFQTFASQTEYASLAGLKLGITTGSCYVITANGALDYFGQTVNRAARLQGLASSGELVMVRQEFEALETATQAMFAVRSEAEERVKGIDEALKVLHLVPADA